MTQPVIMDLGDFIPEQYSILFSIDGRKYEVQYLEARVDEVLPLLVEAGKAEDISDQMKHRRQLVTELFVNNLVVGEPEQLKADLLLVPYTSLRGGLDILRMYAETQSRIKKKDLGVAEVKNRRPFGWLVSLLS